MRGTNDRNNNKNRQATGGSGSPENGGRRQPDASNSADLRLAFGAGRISGYLHLTIRILERPWADRQGEEAIGGSGHYACLRGGRSGYVL
ncbi:hypothetical protein D3C87_1976210 [compost metagenome]